MTSMQYENTAPTDYFQRLISQFEGQMQSYRKQIEQTEQHLQVLGSGTSVTSEDIVAAVQKLHAAFTDPLVQARNSLLSRSQAGPPTLALGTAAPTATFGSLGAAGSFGAPASASAFGAGSTSFGGGFVNPSNTTFGAGNSTTGAFGASTSFGGGFGASSTFGAASPIAGSKRNKH